MVTSPSLVLSTIRQVRHRAPSRAAVGPWLPLPLPGTIAKVSCVERWLEACPSCQTLPSLLPSGPCALAHIPTLPKLSSLPCSKDRAQATKGPVAPSGVLVSHHPPSFPR